MSGINAFFRDVLGAPVANTRWSWGSVDHDRRQVFLRVWRDELSPGGDSIQVLRRAQERSRPGWNERVRHLELIGQGYRAAGVLCERDDPRSSVIRAFDASTLLALGDLLPDPDFVRIEVAGRLDISALPVAGGQDALAEDLAQLAAAPLAATAREALVQARLGQGRYRRQLLDKWGRACAVTGCTVAAVLRASHCKPWRACDDRERLDPHNGLLLQATLDALFDAGLIAFGDDGAMLVSNLLTDDEREGLQLPAPLRRRPGRALAGYLAHHREQVFVG